MAAVANVNAAKYGTSVSIFWIAPFSLDVTDVDPDIWYSVLIHNVTESDCPTVLIVPTSLRLAIPSLLTTSVSLTSTTSLSSHSMEQDRERVTAT